MQAGASAIDPASAYHAPLDAPENCASFDTHTRVIQVDSNAFEDAEIMDAVRLIQAGEVVAFPTETVYGLGANALNGSACKKIFAAKRRPADNPLIAHISSMEMLEQLVAEVPPIARDFLARSNMWPGPLTLLFPAGDKVPKEVTATQPTVAVRMPRHPLARRLIALAGVPIAAPSANSSGRPSPTTAAHVYDDLQGRIQCIIDGGDCDVGVESTVLDITADPPIILRPGGISHEQLLEFLPNVVVYGKAGANRNAALEDKPPTPGMKYRHYSPSAQVVLYEQSEGKGEEERRAQIAARMRAHLSKGESVGIIATTSRDHTVGTESASQVSYLNNTEKEGEGRPNKAEEQGDKPSVWIYKLAQEEEGDKKAAEVAKGLFSALRALDKLQVQVILVEGISEAHTGYAVMNRLRKAASEIIAPSATAS